MAISWALFRDTITIDEELAQEVTDEVAHRDLAAGTTLLLGARVVRHAAGYVWELHDHPLVVLAEEYDGNGGRIDTSGREGDAGTTGAIAPVGGKTVAPPGKDGGPGGDGTPGKHGGPAHAITLLAVRAKDVRLVARGGPGGAGGNGAAGGKGGPGKAEHPPNFPGLAPGDGGPGGDGAKGGGGGPGAAIRFRAVPPKGLVKAPTLDAGGGKAGKGGAAGKGGTAGMEADVGAPKVGTAGTAGVAGTAGKPASAQHLPYTRVSQWWADVAATLGPRATDWAEHRRLVGEFCFRKHRPRVPSRVSWRARARHELVEALRLDPSDARARVLLGYLDAGLTPIALAYDCHPVPDFPRYEEVVTDYGPMVQALFGTAVDMLLHAADVMDNRGRLAAELAHVHALPAVLQSDLQVAVASVAEAQAGLQLAEARLKANEARIEAAQQEMEDASMSLEDKILGSVGAIAGAVVSIAAAIYTGGTSLAGLAASISLLADVDRAMDDGVVDQYGNYVHSVAGDLNAWVDLGAKGGPALTKDAKAFVGGLEDLVKKGKAFYEKVRVVEELFASEVSSELEEEYKELLVAHVELTLARNLATLGVVRGGLEVSAAEQRSALAAADAQALEVHAATLDANIAKLAGIAHGVVRQARGFLDVLLEYRFLAARAVDSWTATTQWSRTFAFDVGYVHPDAEADAYLAAGRGDPARLLDLLGDYVQSWGALPDLVHLRDDYEDHSALLQPHRVLAGTDDPGQLAAFVALGTLSLAVPALPVDHGAPKVVAAYVALVGATAAVPGVEVDLAHPGSTLGAGPVSSPLQCTFAADDLRPVPDDVLPRYYGRDPAVRWRVSIDPASAAAGQLDLSGLTQVLLTVDYLST